MQFLKLSLIGLISINLYAGKFTSEDCLKSSFETIIKSNGQFFGLIKNDLTINKSLCSITVKHNGIFETLWSVDICREPIHFKLTSKGSQSIVKKEEQCLKDSSDDFCYHLKELKTNISDYGLIFAEGIKENISDPHGQVYCTSLLLDRYFLGDYIFSLYEKEVDIFSKQKKDDVLIAPSNNVIETIEEVKEETTNLEKKKF